MARNESRGSVFDTAPPALADVFEMQSGTPATYDGIADGSQPVGTMIFAPTPEDLDEVFAQLADRILTRLTR